MLRDFSDQVIKEIVLAACLGLRCRVGRDWLHRSYGPTNRHRGTGCVDEAESVEAMRLGIDFYGHKVKPGKVMHVIDDPADFDVRLLFSICEGRLVTTNSAESPRCGPRIGLFNWIKAPATITAMLYTRSISAFVPSNFIAN
jgi:hypothetical protein